MLTSAAPAAQWGKNLPTVQETQATWVRFLGQEDPLEKEMATPSTILDGESHGRRSPAGYSPWGHKQLDTTEQLSQLLLRLTISIKR